MTRVATDAALSECGWKDSWSGRICPVLRYADLSLSSFPKTQIFLTYFIWNLGFSYLDKLHPSTWSPSLALVLGNSSSLNIIALSKQQWGKVTTTQGNVCVCRPVLARWDGKQQRIGQLRKKQRVHHLGAKSEGLEPLASRFPALRRPLSLLGRGWLC